MSKLFDEQIRSKYIRLIDTKTKKIIEELTFEQAMLQAKKLNKNLIEIHQDQDYSICMIEDIKKYMYDNQKNTKQQKSEVKTIKMYSDIDFNDLIRKSEVIKAALENGETVRITIKTTKKVKDTEYISAFLASYLVNVKYTKTSSISKERIVTVTFNGKKT